MKRNLDRGVTQEELGQEQQRPEKDSNGGGYCSTS